MADTHIPMPRKANFERGKNVTTKRSMKGSGFLGQREEWIDATVTVTHETKRNAILVLSVAGHEVHVFKDDLLNVLEDMADA